ncbi:MAG: malto-oligosyltrehalose synthase, partial [Gemmatimonadetes bacterium]|nr:malto-oligosyltrehalose synthase [Gemmatimonadota bacterium]NIQ54903.1 malto-oligosyltrehalose synthase [Gemmatimonadota bacterium]NIU75100.1 malto-oligosyltrehalose synthase [Gammaproteobacteria bacterium]NIX44931.1 malto-oligosyltrehalose synthase [Gemmatimonadota bacterium]NIY09164.1 malto-oligosyltrehalose synthase [Gemmatimonadota bacterium]
LLGFLRAVLVGEVREAEARELRMRFQQFTGPVAAKGEEDTAFYRYNRFVALNEVGMDPARWGLSPSGFHDRCRRRAADSPWTLNALSTHDTKRSEDVRARLLVLAEVPERWAKAALRWGERNALHWPAGTPSDPGVEYLLYQTLVGAWPIGPDRAVAYMRKAAREAKLRTSWTSPDEAYEGALEAFIRTLLAGPFREELSRFVAPLVAPGRAVSLAQKLVQLTAPGVPDLYQGTELWDLSLVDPDNRRPVDFDARRRLLDRATAAGSGPATMGGMD